MKAAKALAVLCMLALVLFVSLVPAQAGDGYERYTEWYSDATKTVMVGWRQTYCDGTAETHGSQTAYHETWLGAECAYN